MRLDLAFILCCCKACLGGDRSEEESFYDLLGVDKDASLEEIKRAYKRRSLDLHPDKLAQKGKVVTEDDQARFTRMKEAYEMLSDKHKRETYDAIGEKGMKWIEEPFSVDPREMANNFATSSTLDRSKIFAIFLTIAVAIFILPVLVCLQIDGTFGENSSWAVIATPLWIWNAFMLFYHIRIIMMGPIERPDHIPEEEWFDPLPMSRRYLGLLRFLLISFFEVLAILNLDGIIAWKWSLVFIPIYVLEAITFFRRLKQTSTTIVTVQELESIVGKPFHEFTEEEKEVLSKKYKVVPSKNSQAYHISNSLKENAKTEVIKIIFRDLFLILLLIQLDAGMNWNWWLVFTPFFAMSCCLCCSRCQKYAEVQTSAAEKLDETSTTETDVENGTDYGAMEGGNVPNSEQASHPISEEEKSEIKAQVLEASSKAFGTCCSQFFFLVLICLCLGKLQGAGFSSIWIISPFLFIASIILCTLGCTIFCVAPVDESEMDEYQNMDQNIFTPGASSSPDSGEPPTENNNTVITSESPRQKEAVAKSEELEESTRTHILTPPQVDLLDDNVVTISGAEKSIKPDVGVVPTGSEVDDLD